MNSLLSLLIGMVLGVTLAASLMQSNFKTDCTEAGETRIGDTFYSCDPVGAMVNGERRAFNDAFNDPSND
jgi:hypothetical protein